MSIASALLNRTIRRFASKSDVNAIYRQIEALLEIKEILGPGIPIGPLRGWAISPDALVILLREIKARKAPRVIEFGAGDSTIAIAAVLKARGEGWLTSIEHDAEFANGVSRRLEQARLQEKVEVRVPALRSYGADTAPEVFQSYDLDGFDTSFDIALIDGPPKRFGPGSRGVPLDWVAARLKGDRVAFLDDGSRPAERWLVENMSKKWEQVGIENIRTEKGLFKFICGSQA